MFRRLAYCFAFVAVVGLTSTGPFSARLHAQDCTQELARQDAALRQFETDARRESIDFALDDPRRAALAQVRKGLEGNPTADAAKEIKARWDEYQSYINQAKRYEVLMQELSQCLNGGVKNCLTQIIQRETETSRLLGRVNDAVGRWIESLGNDTISKAAQRVERARSIMQNFTNRAAGNATQAATQGIDSCLRDFDRRVQQSQTSNTPVDLQQPSSARAPAPKKGSSAGKALGIGAAIAGGAAASLWAVNTAKEAIDDANAAAGPGGGTGSSGGSSIQVLQPGPITCRRTSGFNSQCTGTIRLDVGSVFSAGTQIVILTDPSQFLSGQVRSGSSQVTFDINQSIVNVDLNGNVSCRPTQTAIFVYKDTHVGQPATARVSTTIPVSCQ
jgi:hypothetical protein